MAELSREVLETLAVEPRRATDGDVVVMAKALLTDFARIAKLQQPAPWRCMATTTRANFLTPDDRRAVWCVLPNSHAGMHQGDIETQVPSSIEGFMKTVPSQMHWSDGQSEVDR